MDDRWCALAETGVAARKFNWIAKNLLFHSNLMMNIVLLRYEY
jgi:hypothetical protein